MIWSMLVQMLDEKYVDEIFNSFSRELEKLGSPLPSVSLIAEEDNSPYRVLVSTLISLRTKDAVTMEASKRLFEIAPDINALALLDSDKIAETIRPAGFYKRKGENLKKIASIIIEKYNAVIPDDLETLLSLPGVGIKTASLVLNLGYGKAALCVDCHVHEIANRLGWVRTKSAEETEKELRKILPVRFWIPLNELFVRYGQEVCTPVSPFCSRCPENGRCRKIGVQRQR